jgi:RNA polymerase sigma-70 factor, ECF subfamily
VGLLKTIFAAADEQLMWRVRTQDDAEAFGQLVARWQGPIQRLCVRMLGDEHKGEDLAQEAFTRLYAKRADYEPAAKFSTYLWRVALNLCYDELRRVKRRPETALEMLVDGEEVSWADREMANEAAPDSALEQEEQAALVRGALQQLPDHYRAVVALRHYENLKFREIAEALEIPEGTVKSRMAEGLEMLAGILRRAKKADERSFVL